MPRSTEGELRLAMAELVREALEAEGERALAATVRRVTGYRDATVVRWPGMSCEYEQAAVDIFWEDNIDGEFRTYEWRGGFAALVWALDELTERYGT